MSLVSAFKIRSVTFRSISLIWVLQMSAREEWMVSGWPAEKKVSMLTFNVTEHVEFVECDELESNTLASTSSFMTNTSLQGSARLLTEIWTGSLLNFLVTSNNSADMVAESRITWVS